LFFGNEFSFSDYYLKTYFKKERNEREIEKEKEKECKFFLKKSADLNSRPIKPDEREGRGGVPGE